MCTNCRTWGTWWNKDLFNLNKLKNIKIFIDKGNEKYYIKCKKCEILYIDHTYKEQYFTLKKATKKEEENFLISRIIGEALFQE